MNDEALDLASGRYLNESAIRAHALDCSAKFKGGKFTRVGQDFIDEVKIDVEGLIRDLRGKYKPRLFPPHVGEQTFTTGALMERIQHELNLAIGRLIQMKVEGHPSTGKTLGRTR